MILDKEIRSICMKNAHQMSFKERKFICDTLMNDTCINLLVFGAGNDSKLWSKLSMNTYVVEHDSVWLDNMRSKFHNVKNLNFYKTHYNTFNDKLDCIECMQSESDRLNVAIDGLNIDNIKWDAIIVDGPTGYRDANELYRAGSIRLATKVATDKCHIFIHDINRRIESLACEKYLRNKPTYSVDRLNYYIYEQ